jgi:hypothetical protein
MDGVQFSTKSNCAVVVRFWQTRTFADAGVPAAIEGKADVERPDQSEPSL